MKRLSSNWPELVSELESYIPKLYYRRVCWEFPSGQWIQCSTNGASRGNPGKSGAAVVFIDAGGKTIDVQNSGLSYSKMKASYVWLDFDMRAVPMQLRLPMDGFYQLCSALSSIPLFMFSMVQDYMKMEEVKIWVYDRRSKKGGMLPYEF
ncbi:hypothetical protein T459_15063 [Capsicum annuum]|uniref:Uncharacterized protein n=1 Tax=Capsicum annuum TaxID=4072 RepID=A0A2G2ZJ76_CAPAN|nr:hypothetical protein T459_15063 [Capsicum annuum]